jgi:Protein of unknown function (DUF1572)
MSDIALVTRSFAEAFYAQKSLADRAIEQLPDDLLRVPLDENTNAVAVIMKHVAGNLRSRFTDFLSTDGEKPWRNRDNEFVDSYADRAAVLDDWEHGWGVLFETLNQLRDEHLAWTVTIRGEPHSVAAALARALAHVGYHTGQIVLSSRLHCRDHWRTITIPRGGSSQFNSGKGFDPARFSPQGFGPRG